MKRLISLTSFVAIVLLMAACSSEDTPQLPNSPADPDFRALIENMDQHGTRSTTAAAKCNSWERPNWDENENHKHYDKNNKGDKDSRPWPEEGEDAYKGNEDGIVAAHFFIRLDGEAITDHGVIDPKLYYPQTSTGQSYYGVLNKGYIQTDLSKTSLNISNWFYYNSSVRKYIYSSDGTATKAVIEEYPDFSKWEIDGKPIDTEKYHIIWYVVKLQSDGWHVDGILTKKEITELPDDFKDEDFEDITDVPEDPNGDGDSDNDGDDDGDDDGDNNTGKGNGEVEFDIHQQEHKDWSEIKTTVHLRDTVNVRVFIPLDGSYVAVPDDFDIRVGDEFSDLTEQINATYKVGDKEFTTNIIINHKSNGIEILIEGSTCAEALKLARELYDDGITFEIFSYIYPLTVADYKATLWGWIKETECPQTSFEGWPESGDHCTLTFGQLSSAYYDDTVEHYKKP